MPSELRRLLVVEDSESDVHASSFVTKPTAFEHYLDTVRAFRELWLRVARLPAGA